VVFGVAVLLVNITVHFGVVLFCVVSESSYITIRYDTFFITPVLITHSQQQQQQDGSPVVLVVLSISLVLVGGRNGGSGDC
jgi:hypothetical protein